MQNFSLRAKMVCYIFVFALLCLFSRLIYMQFITGTVYKEISKDKISVNIVDRAARGEITDRYGRVLARDISSYSVNLAHNLAPKKEYDIAVEECLKILADYNIPITDDEIDADTGIFCLAENLHAEAATRLKELSAEFPCVLVRENYTREYLNDSIASHILGRVGKINSEEYKDYNTYGYSIHDYIGKQGVERLAESYLKGTCGTIKIGENTLESTPSVPGNNVMLTIDYEMQSVLEKSLSERIAQIREKGSFKSGIDAFSGAGVVIDVNSGEILACASCPTFDINSFTENYSFLINDENLPLWNRAVSGTYSPGSTFKPLVALAALESKSIKTDEVIVDKGIYDYYKDYRPRCWVWTEKHTTHGEINVSQAIECSCNYFFYEAGRRTGIKNISDIASQFGLGEYTGVGLIEEARGYVANPENKKKVFKSIKQQSWYGADTLQASIGQSIHSYTPLQLANYVATLANGGKRYKLSLVKSVRSASDESLVFESKPIIENEISIDDDNLKSVLSGMKNVIEEGSAKAIFDGYHVAIGGKTGTAQVGSMVSNNAIFTAFAPFDKPEIAVCIVLEHGVKGANAAYVAKDLFDYYFK